MANVQACIMNFLRPGVMEGINPEAEESLSDMSKTDDDDLSKQGTDFTMS